ncbi:uncharacterized protein LOC123405458 [Hordeum vulgare subsp. vulgare]|uniref:uncharacterized protein LOC123405458 n=1 Tax=Hordeum vulgare subsp. vulgare TaxID=112509 RepID=UPI001D1A4976|nr:uncharacterized protein LOC123405458 [Hordeum vulgare subsp. vulgare]
MPLAALVPTHRHPAAQPRCCGKRLPGGSRNPVDPSLYTRIPSLQAPTRNGSGETQRQARGEERRIPPPIFSAQPLPELQRTAAVGASMPASSSGSLSSPVESYSSDFCQTLPIFCVWNPFIRLYRSCDTTNERVQFDIEPCGKHLATGGQDGMVHIYDLQGGQWVKGFQAAADTVNGFSFHPYLPLATTSSGHKRFGMQDEFEEESSLAGDENSCSFWKFSCSQEA